MTVTERSQTSLTVEADTLLGEVLADDWGAVSASVYDTARLVALVPDLGGHAARLEFLCQQQAPDGSWGSADGYALMPTLSATEALLGFLRDGGQKHADAPRIARAARGGLSALQAWLRPGAGFPVPDTIAIEFLVPALIADINGHLDRPPEHSGIPGDLRAHLTLPAGLDGGLLEGLRNAVRKGQPLSPKLWASLEAFGPAAAASAQPTAGVLGASPSATAALIGAAARLGGDSLRFLDLLQARGGGPVPGVTPITFFEQSWTLNSFAVAGIGHTAPQPVLESLDAAVGEYGSPAAPGLPNDSDDTAAALYALALHGRPRRPDCLLHFRTDGYFTCFPSERTPSISTNAHILEALGVWVSHRPAERRRFGPSMDMVSSWLLDNQRGDGSWLDKWHASAYYSTACCVLALAAFGGPQSAPALTRAADWVLGTQRPDGSWGRWRGTIEETAYAVQILLRADVPGREDAVARAASAGCAFLTTEDSPGAYPGLWHAKDLYAPIRVIRAARLAALYMGARYYRRFNAGH